MQSPRLLLALSLGVSLARSNGAPGGAGVRLRLVSIFLAVGVALDLIVGLALGYVAIQARDAASSARIGRVAAYQSCLANNEAKMSDLARWDAIVALLRSGPDSPELRAFLDGVEKANGSADAPRNCKAFLP